MAAASPLLSATSSPAFRMRDVRLPAGDPTEAQFVALASPLQEAWQSWRPLPLLTASASPAFLHVTRSVEPVLTASRPLPRGSAPMRPESIDSVPDVIQTDAD
ncbi:MAG: hypothetical protein WD768_23010 [Phycisphaeraceae bacterium]